MKRSGAPAIEDVVLAGEEALKLGRVWDAQKSFERAMMMAASEPGRRLVSDVACRAARAFLDARRGARAWEFYRQLSCLLTAESGAPPLPMEVTSELYYALLASGLDLYVVPLLEEEVVLVGDTRGPGAIAARLSIVVKDERFFLNDAISEFTSLINGEDVREADVHRFFERHPEFLLGGDYQTLHSLPVLGRTDEWPAGIPDFLLEPVDGPLCDILELKSPRAPVVARGRSGLLRFSARVLAAIAQARSYADYFEDPINREWFYRRTGLQAYRPHLIVVIGRRPSGFGPISRRRAEGVLAGVKVATYDDIAERVRRRIERMR